MIILLYGKDTYRKKVKLEEIAEKYKDKYKSGLNIKFYDQSASFSDISDENKQASMFEEKKLVILRDVFSKGNKDAFLKNAQKLISSENIVVFYEDDVNKKDLDLLKKEGAFIQKFDLLSRSKVLSFLRKESQKRDINIEEGGLTRLVDFTGNDLWRAVNELEKLSFYKKKITEEDVLFLVKPDIEANIFKTVDAISEGKKDVAANFIYEHLQQGDHPLYIISMIGRQIRNLLLARDAIDRKEEGLLAKRAGLHPFVAKKSVSQARSFSCERLEGAHLKMLEIDIKVKTGQVDPVMAIHMLLCAV